MGRPRLSGLLSRLYRTPLYALTLSSSPRVSFEPVCAPLREVNPTEAKLLSEGVYVHEGRKVLCPGDPWEHQSEQIFWQRYAHSFDWLGPLTSFDRARARQYVDNWLERFSEITWPAWDGGVLARRLFNFMLFAPDLLEGAPERFVKSFNRSFSRQRSHIERLSFLGLGSFDQLIIQKTRLFLSLFVQGQSPKYVKALTEYCQILEKQVLPDGAHLSRSPLVLLQTLENALEVKFTLEFLHKEVPDSILGAIDRMAPMVRTLRHRDGTLGLFQGGNGGLPRKIDRLLEQSNNQGKPLSDARHSGFQRIEAGQTCILMDTGKPASPVENPLAHAAPLSLEMSVGRERVFGNCGSVGFSDSPWRDALAATAAHSTVCVNDKNCLQLSARGGIAETPLEIICKRIDENGDCLIDASHDAYKGAFGLLHHRSVYLNKSGTDLRVEDKLIGTGGDKFTISLHLSPTVQTNLGEDGRSALLKLSDGSGWHMRTQGVKIILRESVFAGHPGHTQPAEQLVMEGPLRGEGATVKWRLSRIGGS